MPSKLKVYEMYYTVTYFWAFRAHIGKVSSQFSSTCPLFDGEQTKHFPLRETDRHSRVSGAVDKRCPRIKSRSQSVSSAFAAGNKKNKILIDGRIDLWVIGREITRSSRFPLSPDQTGFDYTSILLLSGPSSKISWASLTFIISIKSTLSCSSKNRRSDKGRWCSWRRRFVLKALLGLCLMISWLLSSSGIFSLPMTKLVRGRGPPSGSNFSSVACVFVREIGCALV